MANKVSQIKLIPAEVQLTSAIGASVAIRINAYTADGQPFDLTPYTITAPFISPNGSPAVPPIEEWAMVLETSSVHLSVTREDTLALAPIGSTTWHWAVWLAHNTAPTDLLFAHGDLVLLSP